MYARIISYPKDRSFFLFGPRSTGKSTWGLKAFLKEYPKATAFLLYGGTDRYDEDQIHFTPFTDFFRDAIHLLFQQS